jgi:hypothetical protein
LRQCSEAGGTPFFRSWRSALKSGVNMAAILHNSEWSPRAGDGERNQSPTIRYADVSVKRASVELEQVMERWSDGHGGFLVDAQADEVDNGTNGCLVSFDLESALAEPLAHGYDQHLRRARESIRDTTA